MRTQYVCGVCGKTFRTETEIRGHVAALMETNEKYDGDHPHWRDLDVSHDDLSAWKEEVPGIGDYS